MKFGRIPLNEAEGAILGHGVPLLSGKSFKKGRVLSAEDIEALRAGGYAEVAAARYEPGDVPEDEAAAAVALAAAGDGVRVSAAFTGRCNLYAEFQGLAVLDTARLERLNLVDEAMTVATVSPFEAVERDQMLVTVKVIPFSAPREVVEACVAIAEEGGPLLGVAPLVPHDVGVVLTRVAGMKESILDKTIGALNARLERLGSRIAREIRCAHHEDEVAEAVAEMKAEGLSPILIFGASAIVDRRDVVPAAIEAAGGRVDHFGMPVDPGNLLLLGHHGGTPVIGVPGCGRSPKLNGFDWVLQRLLARLQVSPADIMRMGAGGLLKEIGGRPQPREETKAAAPRLPRVAAVVLAAGQSRRMGRRNKLLAKIDGVPMVARAVDAALASQAHPVVVVTGHEREAVEAALEGREVDFVHNPRFVEGLSASLITGTAALPEDVDGALICLADMPRVKWQHLDRLIAAFNPAEGRAICVPTCHGKRGNPVLFAARFFPEMRAVAGDVGAKHLIGAYGDELCEVAIDDEAIFVDIDTSAALKASSR
ncbi:MAG: molybdopterin-binding/glycosyltransferase family 2 protein [Alphaproteobacteria bacterium]